MLTVSFHKYGNYFFPGTGDIKDVGESHGRLYSVNVPMRDGTDDRTFESLFNPIMSEVMKVFQPGAVVLQCGEIHICRSALLYFCVDVHTERSLAQPDESFQLGMHGIAEQVPARCRG